MRTDYMERFAEDARKLDEAKATLEADIEKSEGEVRTEIESRMAEVTADTSDMRDRLRAASIAASRQDQRIETLEKDVARLLSRATGHEERLAKAEAMANSQERLITTLTNKAQDLESALQRCVTTCDETTRSQEERLAKFEAQLTAMACKVDRYDEDEGARKEERLAHMEGMTQSFESRLLAIERDNGATKAMETVGALDSRVQALEGAVVIAQRDTTALEDLKEQVVELEEELERQDKIQVDSQQQMLEAFKQLESRFAAKTTNTMRPPTTPSLPFTSMEGGLVQQWIFSFMCLHEQGDAR